MGVMFQAIYAWAAPLMDAVEAATARVGELALRPIPAEWEMLRSLVETGIFGGVAAVLVFLPQILLLFLFITVLEDLGYLSRAAFLMDRLMARVGLTGRSFIPLLSSFACAVPAILSTRTIRDRNARLATIFLAPFMSCSARLPVYVLFIGAFVPSRTVLGFLNLQGLTLFAMYWVGILAAIPTAWLLQRSVLQTRGGALLMELPSYKLPSLRNVGRVVTQRGAAFVRRAGTVILAVALLVWAAAYFPRDPEIDRRHDAALATVEQAEAADRIEARRQADHLANSFLGRAGKWVEPVVRPLGWDWRIGMAAIASFPAREVIVATLGTIFSLGADTDEESDSLRQAIRGARDAEGRPLFSLATALSVMVFFALCAQCAATLAVMRRETHGWRWPSPASST